MENKNGGYGDEGVLWHQHSNLLMRKILELWTDKSIRILDLGCGHNWYVSVLNHFGYHATGIDMVDLGSNAFIYGDITDSNEHYDPSSGIASIISLEVGEHIPAELADNYFKNLTAFGGDIIMSWAIPGQEGIGHINCQPNEWVIEEMAKRGYKLHAENTAALREEVKFCHCNWFKNTLMYFQK